MPIVTPMRTMNVPEFNTWYTTHRTATGIKGFEALSKEDRKKARERLVDDMRLAKSINIRKMYKENSIGFMYKKEYIDEVELARYIRDKITTEEDLDLFDAMDAVPAADYYNEPDGEGLNNLRKFIKQVNKKYPGSFKCDYSSDDQYLPLEDAENYFTSDYLSDKVDTYNEMATESGEYDEIEDMDDATYITSTLTIDGTNDERDHDQQMWDLIAKMPK